MTVHAVPRPAQESQDGRRNINEARGIRRVEARSHARTRDDERNMLGLPISTTVVTLPMATGISAVSALSEDHDNVRRVRAGKALEQKLIGALHPGGSKKLGTSSSNVRIGSRLFVVDGLDAWILKMRDRQGGLVGSRVVADPQIVRR